MAKLCPALCSPMDCSTPGFPVLCYLPGFATVTAGLYKLFSPQPWVLSLHQCADGHSANTQGHPLEIPGVPFVVFFFFFYWLCLVFGVVCGIFIHGLRTLMQHAGSSSLTRDQTWAPALAAWSLPWTSREVLWWFFLYSAFSSLVFCPVSASYLGVPGPSS